MRISGGEWRGRLLKTPPGDKIRPTQDWVREALFSVFTGRLEGSAWVDLFAGSGAVGLDALSRGAASVVWVEKDIRNAKLICENFLSFADSSPSLVSQPPVHGIPRAARNQHHSRLPSFPLPQKYPGTEIACSDAERWIVSGGCGRQADILFADPPYEDARKNGFSTFLSQAAAKDVVKKGGFFVAEMPDDKKAETVEGWEIVRDRAYGKTRMVIWRREQ